VFGTNRNIFPELAAAVKRLIKMSDKKETKFFKKVRESLELENCQFRQSKLYRRQRRCCHKRCYRKWNASDVQSMRKLLLGVENRAAMRWFLEPFQDLNSRPIRRYLPDDTKHLNEEEFDGISVCQQYFKWVWGVSNTLVADPTKDKRKLLVI